MLAIHMESRIRRYLHSFSISSDAVAQAMQFLDETLDAEKCPPEIHSSFNIVVDEIVSNIVKFSQASSFELAIEPVATPHSITLVFIDNGTPYDPLSHIDPDTTLSADKRPIGGLGILMVKRLADSVSYRREHNRNFFSVSMKL